MKKYIIYLLTVSCYSCMGQTNETFTLKGSINVDSGLIAFYNFGGESEYPSDFNFSFVPVEKGRFLIEGKIHHPTKLRLLMKVNGNVYYVSDGFYIEAGNQAIICKSDTTTWDREIPDIRNSTMLEFLNQYRTPEYRSLDTVNDYYKSKELKRKYLYQYAQKHPDSYVALWEISDRLIGGYDKQIDSAFEQLSGKIKSSGSGQLIRNDLRLLALTDTGRIFPAFLVVDLKEKTRKLSYSTLNAKYILLDFWFSHCSACISQFPEYIKMVDQYNHKGFNMIGVTIDSTRADIAAWKKVIKSRSLNWTQYRVSDWESLNNLRIYGYPKNYLLDRTGRIVAVDLDTKQLSDLLQSNLN
jgi:thiol-disulfide isomerase/thioredoxin